MCLCFIFAEKTKTKGMLEQAAVEVSVQNTGGRQKRRANNCGSSAAVAAAIAMEVGVSCHSAGD